MFTNSQRGAWLAETIEHCIDQCEQAMAEQVGKIVDKFKVQIDLGLIASTNDFEEEFEVFRKELGKRDAEAFGRLLERYKTEKRDYKEAFEEALENFQQLLGVFTELTKELKEFVKEHHGD